MNPLSSCCKAPVKIAYNVDTNDDCYLCENCGKPCTVTTSGIFNNSPVNVSAVEELRKEFDEKIGNWLDYTHKVGYHNCPDKETAWNWFLTHTAALSDSTLREVLGLKKRLETDYHGYSPEADIYNTAIDDAISIIKKQ